MDKHILDQYIDACTLIEETEKDIQKLRQKKRTVIQTNVSGSNPEHPYNPQHFKIQGTTFTFREDSQLRMEEKLLEKRKEDAEKIKTRVEEWMNTIPSYSAWWVINLCDYCKLTGNNAFFEENKDYAKEILEHFDICIDADGTMNFGENKNAFFLDWPTKYTPDAVIGTATIILLAAKMYLKKEENATCHSIIRKLSAYLVKDCVSKQTRAFQVLAGRETERVHTFLEKGGAEGFSTFMAYYILKADAMAGGVDMLPIIKEYYGAMLSRGATTFWEDFNMDWLEGSGRIDELPREGEKDIHGDYGAFCYEGFRHSLCHGWASGVLAFFIEHILGLEMSDGGKCYEVHPNTLGIDEIYAKIPTVQGWIEIQIQNSTLVKCSTVNK